MTEEQFPRSTSNRRATATVAIAVAVTLATAGCQAANVSHSPLASATPTDSPEAPTGTRASSPSRSPRAAIPIVNCAVDDARTPSPQSPVPVPVTLPAALPVELLPEDAAVYASGYPIDPEDPSSLWSWNYTAGPVGFTCQTSLGNYLRTDLIGGSGQTLSVFVPGSHGPAVEVSCAYIQAALEAARDFFGADFNPADCRGQPGETVTQLDSGISDAYIAAVVGPSAGSRGLTTVALYTFVNGGGATAECTLPVSRSATCVANLAFFLAGGAISGMTAEQLAATYQKLGDLSRQ